MRRVDGWLKTGRKDNWSYCREHHTIWWTNDFIGDGAIATPEEIAAFDGFRKVESYTCPVMVAELDTAPASETLRVDFNNMFCGAACGICGEGFEAAHAIHAYAGDDFGQIVCDDCACSGGTRDELLELRDVHRVARWLNACGYDVRDDLDELRRLAADWRVHHGRAFGVAGRGAVGPVDPHEPF